MTGKEYDPDEAFERLIQHEEKMKELVYIDRDSLIINVAYEYVIALSRCDTLEKILGWVSHLTEKTWMTMDVMDRFIHLACAHHGLELPNP